MKTAAIAAILFGSFGLPVPRDLPPPAPADRCLPLLDPLPPLRLDRLMASGALRDTHERSLER